jgi:hypothetical protein
MGQTGRTYDETKENLKYGNKKFIWVKRVGHTTRLKKCNCETKYFISYHAYY